MTYVLLTVHFSMNILKLIGFVRDMKDEICRKETSCFIAFISINYSCLLV